MFNAHTWEKLLIFSMHGNTLFNICRPLIGKKLEEVGGGREESLAYMEFCLGMEHEIFPKGKKERKKK